MLAYRDKSSRDKFAFKDVHFLLCDTHFWRIKDEHYINSLIFWLHTFIFKVKLYSENTGKSPEEIEEDIKRPKYFSPSEAVEYGIIDKVSLWSN